MVRQVPAVVVLMTAAELARIAELEALLDTAGARIAELEDQLRGAESAILHRPTRDQAEAAQDAHVSICGECTPARVVCADGHRLEADRLEATE